MRLGIKPEDQRFRDKLVAERRRFAADSPGRALAVTRAATRQLSGHFPAGDVQAFRVLAAEQDRDGRELLAEAINMAFERHGKPNRIEIMSGRRKRLA